MHGTFKLTSLQPACFYNQHDASRVFTLWPYLNSSMTMHNQMCMHACVYIHYLICHMHNTGRNSYCWSFDNFIQWVKNQLGGSACYQLKQQLSKSLADLMMNYWEITITDYMHNYTACSLCLLRINLSHACTMPTSSSDQSPLLCHHYPEQTLLSDLEGRF